MEINNLTGVKRKKIKDTLIERTEESRYYLSSEEYNNIRNSSATNWWL